MATVFIDPEKLGRANKYANLQRNKAKREYVQAYIAWLRNGAEGIEPDRGKLSEAVAEALRAFIDGMKLWEGTV